MAELWLPVLKYEGVYEVSNQGRVRSLDREVTGRNGVTQHLKGRLLSATKADYGPPVKYARVDLQHEGRKRGARVHILVLEHFVGPRPPGLVACHGANGIADNSIGNLRWDTYSANNFDLVSQGRHWQARKTQCKNGHKFTPENTIIRAEGGRKCRRCQYDAAKRWYDNKRGTT